MVKKRIPTVIDTCLDCPFVYIGRGSSEYSVNPHYLCGKTHGTVLIGHDTGAIPDWCPLDNAIDFSKLTEKMERGILQPIYGDIICRFMRKNRGGD